MTMLERRATYSTEDIERLLQPMAIRIRHQGNRILKIMIAFGVVLGASIGVIRLIDAKPGEDVRQDVWLVLLFFFFFGVLPGLAARHLYRRDLHAVPRLINEGSVFSGRLISNAVGPSGMHHVRIVWNENGKDVGAHFLTEQMANELDKAVDVVAIKNRSPVAVVINGSLHVAVRNARQYHVG